MDISLLTGVAEYLTDSAARTHREIVERGNISI